MTSPTPADPTTEPAETADPTTEPAETVATTHRTDKARRWQRPTWLIAGTIIAGVALWLMLIGVMEALINPYSFWTFVSMLLLGLAFALAVSQLKKRWALIPLGLALAVLFGGSLFKGLSLGANPLIWVLSFGLLLVFVLGGWWFVKKHLLA